MIKKSSKQNGSAHVIIISVIILAILGALGFVFWNNFIKNKAEPTKAASKETSHSKVFNIPELDISIELPSSINDLTYTYTTAGVPTHAGGDEVIVGSVNFSTSTLTSKYPECSSAKSNPLGGLIKITGTYKEGELGPTWSGGGVIKQFPDSYLAFAGPQSACFSSVAGSNTTLGKSITSQMNDLSTAIKNAKETGPDSKKNIDTSIHSVDIKMQTASDIGKLPSYTPASFVTYMKSLLANNSSREATGCGMVVAQYQISQISQVNITGGVVPVNEGGETCTGGAPDIWVLNPASTWDEETRNGTVCRSKNGGAVYQEFASECDPGNGSFIKNPNGSITSLGK